MTIGLVLLVFVPQHRHAGRDSRAAAQGELELQGKVAMLARLPDRKHRLDSLGQALEEFRGGLARTDQVDRAMRSFEDRARSHDVECWILNPSVPTLVTLEASADSITALNLALLPVEFECQGDYTAVGRFIESEERRPQFSRWERLTITAGPGRSQVRAHGEVQIFLLPAAPVDGGPS